VWRSVGLGTSHIVAAAGQTVALYPQQCLETSSVIHLQKNLQVATVDRDVVPTELLCGQGSFVSMYVANETQNIYHYMFTVMNVVGIKGECAFSRQWRARDGEGSTTSLAARVDAAHIYAAAAVALRLYSEPGSFRSLLQ